MPADLVCPTVWLVASADDDVIANAALYRAALRGTAVQLHVVAWLDQEQTIEQIDRVFDTLLALALGG